MGISTVAVYSDPDRDAPFVAEADRALALGGATPAESYLRGDAIIEAARATGVDAIHPGYGFLAENADFARAVTDAGLVWVGPNPEAIETMGSKLASKEVFNAAGVPTLATHDLTGVADDEVGDLADDLGYPVLVKASAGGGGKGMRIVGHPEELAEAVAGARREADSAFGDSTIFLERFLDRARHIEIQVLADAHGNTISCGERECSIQRRHQKIIEEAPSPVIDPETRDRMGEAAVIAADAVGYSGAGTVEFLYQNGNFWFLEMNTRLQVEHPVTEEVHGIDLVEWQIRVANQESLPTSLVGDPVGHSIEVRLYAEDPNNGYLPSTGVISRFEVDETRVRVDTGVESGSVIGIHYDPLLAKVVAWSPERRRTAAILSDTLRRSRVHGVVTNISLLVNILEHGEFLAGETDTTFLERHPVDELGRPLLDKEEVQRCAVAAALHEQQLRRTAATVQETIPSGWRNNPSQPQVVTYLLDEEQIEIRYSRGRDETLGVEGFDSARIIADDTDSIMIELDSLAATYHIGYTPEVIYVSTTRGSVALGRVSRHPVADSDDVAGSLHAPMPGRVVEVTVATGDEVVEGTVLMVMEAMKMEHTLRAPHAGIVTEVGAGPGDQVDADAILVVVEEADS